MARSDGMECDESRCLDRQDGDRLRRRDGDAVRPSAVAAAGRHAAAPALALALPVPLLAPVASIGTDNAAIYATYFNSIGYFFTKFSFGP